MKYLNRLDHKYRGVLLWETAWESGAVSFHSPTYGFEAESLDALKVKVDELFTKVPYIETDAAGNYILQVSRDLFGIPLK